MRKLISKILCVTLLASTISMPLFAKDTTSEEIVVSTNIGEVELEDEIPPEDVDEREPESVEALVTAGGFAVADGPLPIGDMIASGILIFEGGCLVVDYAPSFFEWLADTIGSVFNKSKVKDGAKIKAKFPDNTGDMDELTGKKGEHKPDTKSTPGRKKTVWDLGNGKSVVREKHPYDKQATKQHRSWHWHYNDGNGNHYTYSPGDTIPTAVWEAIANS